MKRLLLGMAVAAALIAPKPAHAGGSRTYDFCGGSYSGYTGFAFCASVNVSVVAASNADGLTHAAGSYTVSIDITNKSGENGSYLNSLFIQIGLDNLVNDLATPANVRITQGGNVICTNVLDTTTGKAKCYNVQEDKKAAGGVRLDFLAQASTGVSQYAIASCTATPTGVLKTCPAAGPVRISFDVTSDFDPNNGVDVYVKGQGALGSTECETGTNRISCVPGVPTTTTPEPATLALVGTGLVAVMARRKRKAAAIDAD